MSPTGIISIVAAVAILAAAGMGWLLKNSYEANGALKTSLTAATTRLKEINDVHKEMDKVHGTNNALPDDKLFDGLLQPSGG